MKRALLLIDDNQECRGYKRERPSLININCAVVTYLPCNKHIKQKPVISLCNLYYHLNATLIALTRVCLSVT